MEWWFELAFAGQFFWLIWSQLDSFMNLSAAGWLAVGCLAYNNLDCDSWNDSGLCSIRFLTFHKTGRYSYDGKIPEQYEGTRWWASAFHVHWLTSYFSNCLRFATTHWLKQVSWPNQKQYGRVTTVFQAYFPVAYLEKFSTHRFRHLILHPSSQTIVQSSLLLHWSHCIVSMLTKLSLFLDWNYLREETRVSCFIFTSQEQSMAYTTWLTLNYCCYLNG